MLIIGGILVLAVYVGLIAGAGRIVFLWLQLILEGLSPLVFGLVYAGILLLILAAFIASRIPEARLPRVVFHFGHYALGVLVYILLFVYATALLVFLGGLLPIIPSSAAEAVSITAGALCLAGITAISVYGAVHGRKIQTARYTVELGDIQGDTDTLRIALVSDIHLGYAVEEAHLAKIVAAVNETGPDIVCIAGDIFDGDITALSDPDQLAALFREMESTYGVYACLGNHDAGGTHAGMLEFLSRAGIRVLRDEAVVIDDRVLLAGRRDSGPIGAQGDPREPLAQMPGAEELPVIVMDHRPENIGEYGGETDLVLCGHTHRGQVFPLNLFTKRMFPVDYGYYRASDRAPQVIVTSGAGTWGPPMRVGSDSEIAEIQVLFPKSKAQG